MLKILLLNRKKIAFIIFLLSIATCFGLYQIEIFLDKINYHPDSFTYLTPRTEYNELFNVFSIKNLYFIFYYHLGYYLISYIAGYHELILISLNIFLYSITNAFLFILFIPILKKNFHLLLLLLVLFLPYRAHLAIHVLKETILIFLLFLPIYFLSIRSLFIISLLGFLFRSIFLLYLFIFFNFKKFKKLYFLSEFNFKKIFFILFVSIVFYILIAYYFLSFALLNELRVIYSDWGNSFMGGREYDNIPNFGVFFRIFVWPILFLSGTFSFFSNSYLFYILSIEIIILHFVIYYFCRKIILNLALVSLLILIATYTTSFTSFFRYCYVPFYIYCLVSIYECKKKEINFFN
jgi:hypothetical protein